MTLQQQLLDECAGAFVEFCLARQEARKQDQREPSWAEFRAGAPDWTTPVTPAQMDGARYGSRILK